METARQVWQPPDTIGRPRSSRGQKWQHEWGRNGHHRVGWPPHLVLVVAHVKDGRVAPLPIQATALALRRRRRDRKHPLDVGRAGHPCHRW